MDSYIDYFGFKKKPFSIVPNPELIFLSRQHQNSIVSLQQALTNLGGIWLLTGEVGMGKTTVSKAVLQQLPEHIEIAYLLYVQLNTVDFYKQILDEIGVEVPAGTNSEWQLINLLNTYLLDLAKQNKHLIIVIEEAQNMSPQLLESVRTLTNLETSENKLLTLFLIGQNELLQTIEQKQMRQLDQRVQLRLKLEQFSLQQSVGYINYRLFELSGSNTQLSFLSKCLIHFLTKGTPRLINHLCHQSLQLCFEQRTTQVGLLQVIKANKRQKNKRWTAKKGVLLLLLLSLPLAYIYREQVYQWQQQNLIFQLSDQQSTTETIAVVNASTPTANATAAANISSAMIDLVQLWGIDPKAKTSWQQLCQNLPKSLQCYQNDVLDFEALKRINLPVIVNYNSGNVSNFVVVTNINLDDSTITFLKNGEPVVVDMASYLQNWSGGGQLLWQPPASYNRVLSPNQRNKQFVNWLQIQLRNKNVISERFITGGLYNAILVDYVKQFQQDNGLQPDGIIGIQTVLALSDDATDQPQLIE